MKRIIILEYLEKKFILACYFKSDEEICKFWSNLSCPNKWNIIYEKTRERSGHRYELKCDKYDKDGKLYSKYIICYSKKESLYLEKIINETNLNYITTIKKLY